KRSRSRTSPRCCSRRSSPRRRHPRRPASRPGSRTQDQRRAVVHWLASLPAGLIFVIFAGIAIGVTFLFDVIMRKFVAPEVRERASATASVTLQVTATIYAILIAFVIVDAYSQLRDTQSTFSEKPRGLAAANEKSRD